jgi:hypothetical protein
MTATVGTGLAEYAYGVVRADSARGTGGKGIAGAAVRPIAHRGLAVLASPVERRPIRARRAELRAHTEVLTRALADGPVLPFRFGAVFADNEAVVEEFLRPRYAELDSLLRRFRDKVELSLKGLYDQDAVLAEIVRNDGGIARLREATRRTPAAAGYPMRVQLGEAVMARLDEVRRRDAATILARLRPHAYEIITDDRPFEQLVLKASFLVDRDAVPRFDAAVSELAEEHRGRIRFAYVGPLALHSFAEISPEAA